MLHLAYGLISIVLTALSTVVGIQQQLKVMEWVAANKSSKWAQGGGAGTGLIIMIAMLALAIVWPLFCLVWFGAMKKNPADNPPPTTEHV